LRVTGQGIWGLALERDWVAGVLVDACRP
jgi:hypothetical protein